jgi:hypothetical protein
MKGGMRILGWTQDDSERLLYECHEGNYGLKQPQRGEGRGARRKVGAAFRRPRAG